MDNNLRRRIESAAWDCTVGAGIDPDEADKPTPDNLDYLAEELGRKPTDEELKLFNDKWNEGVRCVAQP